MKIQRSKIFWVSYTTAWMFFPIVSLFSFNRIYLLSSTHLGIDGAFPRMSKLPTFAITFRRDLNILTSSWTRLSTWTWKHTSALWIFTMQSVLKTHLRGIRLHQDHSLLSTTLLFHLTNHPPLFSHCPRHRFLLPPRFPVWILLNQHQTIHRRRSNLQCSWFQLLPLQIPSWNLPLTLPRQLFQLLFR